MFATLAVAACGGGGGGDSTTSPIANVTVSVTVSDGGTATPATQQVPAGTVVTINVSPNEGFVVADVTGCNGSLSGTTYTTSPVNRDCSISVTFEVATYIVSTVVRGDGQISPTEQEVSHGEQATFSVQPARGYTLDEIEGCGGRLNGSQYVTAAVISACTIEVEFVQLVGSVVEMPLPDEGRVTGFFVENSAPGVAFAITSSELVGDGAAGIWRTIDGGSSWQRTWEGTASFIRIASGDPDLVLAGVTQAYLVSTDQGVSWRRFEILDTVFGSPRPISDLAAHTAEEGIYISVASVFSAGLYRSTNLGESVQHIFTEQDAGSDFFASIRHIALAPSAPETLYIATQGDLLLKSVDSGQSFFSITEGLTVGPVTRNGLRLDPTNADRLFVIDNITVNGGANWTQSPSLSPRASIWIEGRLVRISYDSFFQEGALQVSDDLGASWQDLLPLSLDQLTGPVPGIDQLQISGDQLYFHVPNGGIIPSVGSIRLSTVTRALAQ